MTTYKGVKITGTSTTAKAFPKSGVSSAKVGDYYINTETGHKYYCSTKGKPADARWKYDSTPIDRVPTVKVSGLTSPKRGTGSKFSVSWKVPDALVSDKKRNRATKLQVWAIITTEAKKQGDWARVVNIATSNTSASFDLNNFAVNAGGSDTLTRQSFYPITNRKLKRVYVAVYSLNKIGSEETGKADSYIAVKPPAAPTIGTPTIDANGRVSCVITPAADSGMNERYRTRYQIDVLDSSAGGTWKTVQDSSFTADSAQTKSYDVANWQVAGKYVRVRFRAMSQGWGGDSSWTSYKEHLVGWPAEATIQRIDIFTKNATDIATVHLNTNSTPTYPTDQIRLQVLKSTTIDTADEAILSNDWDDTEFVDNAKSSALACTVSDLMPERGKHTWVRVKSWHDIEGIFYVFSKPVEVTQLYEPPRAQSDAIKIISATKGGDGTKAVILVAWDKDGSDTADGTELSWSDDDQAWISTDPPNTFEFTEDDGAYTDTSVTPSVAYRSSRTVVIKGLDEGAPLYVKARRYAVDGADRAYGDYSSMETVIPSIAASSVVLKADSYAAEGSDIPFSWVFAGSGVQTSWMIRRQSDDSEVAKDDGPLCFASVDAEQAALKAENGKLTVYVAVSTGSEEVRSDPVSVAIVALPTISVDVGDLTVQPLSFDVECSSSTCFIAAGIVADGSAAVPSTGTPAQLAGDTVWTDVIEPEWAAAQGSYACEVTLPEGMDFRDGAGYRLVVQAVESQTGLRSAEASEAFSVLWAHQAPTPPDTIEIDAAVSESDSGSIDRKATIALAPPTVDAAGNPYADEFGDVYDIYRVTGDGICFIGGGYGLSDTVEDRYAPFGDATHFYRVVLRTVDGDTAWDDFDYYLEGNCLRFDFDGESHTYVELPWEVSVSDSYAKDFKRSKRMDGTIGGTWAKGTTRDQRLETKIVRFDETDKADAVRDLARCESPVFVRTYIGTAFAANVTVAPIEVDGALFACSMTAEEFDLTDRFMLTVEGEDEEEEEGEG